MNAQNLVAFIVIITVRCDEDLSIRIGLPEYICDKDGGVRDVSREMTTIRLLGKDAQNVGYKFDVNFHTIGKKCQNNQRCTLLLWRSVRELDRYLKTYPTKKLQSGLVEVNNSMFVPGIKYILNVTLIGGTVVQERQLTLDYVDDSVRKNVTKPMASLFLLAPDTSYAYAAYVVSADVNICSNVSSFYFKWELVGENSTRFPSRSAELVVPPDTFRSSLVYTIKCDLIGVEDGATIANSLQTVTVLSKGVLLRLPVKRLATGTGRSVRVKAYVRDLDNSDEEMTISWSCLELTNNEECQVEGDGSELEVESRFKNPGTYKVSIEISRNDATLTDSCIVEVNNNAPIVDIEEIEYPSNPSTGIEIHASVYELKTSCTLQWTSPAEDGYEALDLAEVPGNVDAIVNVTTKEDFFLHELEEFNNGTVDRRHNLIIPPPSDSWEGLKGDAKYLFRLTITCPSSDEVLDEFNETGAVLTDSVTATSDVIIETNAPPSVQDLEVAPSDGDAFLTKFIFKTSKAEDKDGDGPILYKFGYILGNRDVILWNLGDVTNCEATLPYSEDGIQTFVEGCDNFNSCGRVLGPLIQTKLPEGVDLQAILQRFLTRMNAADYSRAFLEGFVILQSYKSQEENSTREVISHRVAEEIDKLLKLEDYTDDQKIIANDLMENVNDYNSHLQLPESVINKVLELRNRLSDESERYTQRKLLWNRVKRASSLHDIRNYIEISELIITTTNDPHKISLEKEKLRKQLPNYMEKLCVSLKKAQFTLELKTVILSVEKLNKNSLNNLISVPFEGNSWQIFARIRLGNVVKDARLKCIGKAIFKDYLDKTGVVYFADILNTSDINEAAEIVIYLPKNKSADGTPNCLVYRSEWRSDCTVVQNIANYVKCSCKYLGYYYLEYSQVTDPPAVTPTSRATVVPTGPERIVPNDSLAQYRDKTKGNYDTVSYVVIVASVIGIIVLTVTVRKIFHDDDDKEDSETFEFPKYAQLHDEEFLNDAHI